jgi:hypothetical protein
MSDNSAPQQVFTLADVESAIVVPFHLYDMSWEHLEVSGHLVKFTYKDVHDGIAKPMRAYVTDDYSLAYQQMHDTTGMKMQDILSNVAKLGCSIWEHENEKVYKQTLEVRANLYKTNYKACKEIFGWNNRKKAEQKDRSNINVICDSKGVVPVICKYASYLNISESMMTAGFLAEGFLRWDGLADDARDVMEKDVEDLIKRRDKVVEACLKVLRTTY